MVRILLNTFPTSMVILTMMLIGGIAAYCIYSLIHRFLTKYSLNQDPLYARETIYLISTFCAFLLAFMIVTLWQSYGLVEKSVLDEAKAIGRIEIFSQSLPEKNDLEISTLLESYNHALIHDEWPLMASGDSSKNADELILSLRRAIENIEKKNSHVAQYRHQMLQDYNDLVFSRELRLEHLKSAIPNFFMFTILANLFALFLLLCLLPTGAHKRIHHLFLFITGMILGLNLSFLMILDYPFSGELSVSSAPLLQIHFD